MKSTLKHFALLALIPLAFVLIAAAPSGLSIFRAVTANTNGAVQWPMTLAMSNATANGLTVSNNITVIGTNIGGYFSGDGGGLTNLTGASSTDNSKVATNAGTLWSGRLIGGGGTNLAFTNANFSGGTFTNLTNATATANRVATYNASGVLTNGGVSDTTLAYLDATSSVQTQINGKQPTNENLTAFASNLHTNQPWGNPLFINLADGAARSVTVRCSNHFSLHFTNLPTDTNVSIPIEVRFINSSNVVIYITNHATMTNTFGQLATNRVTATNGQSTMFGATVYGGTNNTYSNVFHFFSRQGAP